MIVSEWIEFIYLWNSIRVVEIKGDHIGRGEKAKEKTSFWRVGEIGQKLGHDYHSYVELKYYVTLEFSLQKLHRTILLESGYTFEYYLSF